MSRTKKPATGLRELLSEPTSPSALGPEPQPPSSSTPAGGPVVTAGDSTPALATDSAPTTGPAPEAPTDGRAAPWPAPVDSDRIKVTIVFEPEDYAALQWLAAEVVRVSGVKLRRGPGGGAQADVVRTAVEVIARDPLLRERVAGAFLTRRGGTPPAP